MTCMDIERVSTHTMLGVVVNDGLMATDHVNHLLSSAARLLYALLILRSHGTPTQSLYDIFRATVIAKLTYCSPAWAGSCSAAECSRINSFLTRCKCFGFCDNNLQAIEVLFSKADDAFSQHIINNNLHVLQTFLLESPEVQYHFRPRSHDKLLIPKTVDLSKRDFIIHLLNCYWLFYILSFYLLYIV